MDASSYAGELVILAILLLVSAFFSASETALFSANRLKLRHQKEGGSRRAGIVLGLLENPARLLSTILVGNHIVNTAAAVVATATLVQLFGQERGSLYAFIAVTALLLIFGAITPKAAAARGSDRLAVALARPVLWISWVLSPIIRILSFVTNVLAGPFGARVRPDAPMVTEEEIALLVRMGEEQGGLEQEEREMIHSIIDFGDTVVREVMTPRIDIVSVAAEVPVEAVLEVVRTHGHSRIPVYQDTVDQIVGVIHVKDLLAAFRGGRLTGNARAYARPAYFVPESKRLDELFKDMRRRKVHMAIVVDEYGGTAGLVTIEDLLEEIVGPIQDEYDVEEPPIKRLSDRTSVVDGRMHLEEVNAALDLALPVGDVDSLGGFVYSLLGHVPTQGERVDYDGVELSVERVDGNRIAKVRITKAEPAATVDQ